MKTRTLLLLAVTCGLLILVAGSIKVFLIADDKPPAHLAIGASSTIGDMTVTVTGVTNAADETLIAVRLIGVDDSDGARSFVFGTGSQQLIPHQPPNGDGTACGATSAGTETSCVLAFDAPVSNGVLRYDRAGQTLRWDIYDTRTLDPTSAPSAPGVADTS